MASEQEEPSYQTKSSDPMPGSSPQSTAHPTSLQTGTLLNDRYQIERELGRGGMGAVYLARDKQLLSKQVVVKILLEESLRNEWVVQKFRQEMEALTRIEHPGIIGILDAGEVLGVPYIVMQYVEGTNLRVALKPGEGMELERTAEIVKQIGDALNAAHDENVLHRDLKPENIMLRRGKDGREQVKLIDFGIAKVKGSVVAPSTVASMTVGTYGYMSPEQLNGRPVSHPSDIYAFGIVVYEMVTGRLPFNPDSPFQLVELQKEGVKVKPKDLRQSLPDGAQRVILKALSYAPKDRYQTAREFGHALWRTLAEDADDKPDSASELVTRRLDEVTPADDRQPTTQGAMELGHVLFTDIVGYSKLPIDKQTEILGQLQQLVRASAEFNNAQASNQLIRLPTGDGMALVFFGDPESPVRCALEISRALQDNPQIKLRMGIHSGPVNRVLDVNDKTNVAGTGINMAQRVMDCGDDGHILLSKRVADDLAQYSHWPEFLHDLGETEVKHGVRVHVVNLYKDGLGNPDLPAKFRPQRKIQPPSPITIAAAGLGLLILIVAVWFVLFRGKETTQSKVGADGNGQTEVAVEPERTLVYSLTVQKFRGGGTQDGVEFQLPDANLIFEAKYQVKLNVTTPQPGYFYVLNQAAGGGTPGLRYIMLYPSDADKGNRTATSIRVPAPADEWFEFDNKRGTEKLWLVWSEKAVPELEATKDLANQQRGEVKDPERVKAIQETLARYSADKPQKNVDEAAKQTRLTTRQAVIAYPLNLEHQ